MLEDLLRLLNEDKEFLPYKVRRALEAYEHSLAPMETINPDTAKAA
jgi:hypothetical protein